MLVPMLLRNSISNTKKFLRKTLRSFKSFFYAAETAPYQQLPKTSPYHPYSFNTVAGVDMDSQTSYPDLEKFYSHFTDKWDSGIGEAKKRNKTTKKKKKKKKIISTPTEEQKDGNEGNVTQYIATQRIDHHEVINQCKTRSVKVEKRQEDSYSSGNTKKEEEEEEEEEEARSLSVAQKLKELEMMDRRNVDHVLDIEEVLHYYSRLTCPAYLDIVDKFFMDMYAEILGTPASPKSVNSRHKFRSVRS